MKRNFILFILMLLSVENIYAQAGQIDSTFGYQGSLINYYNKYNSEIYDIKILPNGTLAYCGTFDQNFISYSADLGGNGFTGATFDFNYYDIAYALTFDQNSHILMVGTSSNYPDKYPRILKMADNGNMDLDFDTSRTLNDFLEPFVNGLTDVVTQKDNKLLIAGSHFTPGRRDAVVFRLLPNGVIDSTFSQNGFYNNNFENDVDENVFISLDSEENIIICAYTPVDQTLVLTKLTSNGIPITSFGTSGVVRAKLSSFRSSVRDVVVLPDNKILVTGEAGYNSLDRNMFVYRFNSDGTFDSKFGSDGKVIYNSGNRSGGMKILEQNDGKILCAGYIVKDDLREGGVVRFNSNGEVDRSFGKEGTTIFEMKYGSSIAQGICLQPDGKIILVGNSRLTATENKNFLVRLLNDIPTSIDNKFGIIPFDVYPNPSTGNININSSEPFEYIELYDVLGRKEVHYEKSFVSNLKGTVLLNMVRKTGKVSKRIILE